jgi:glycosyltransferase involved in cell wall biosynthesis
LFDYYLAPHANDLAEEPGADMPVEYFHWRRAAHAMDLLDLENGAFPWTHTQWQRDLFPVEYRRDFHVLHDGVDVAGLARPHNRPRQVAGRTIPAGTRVVTFIARNLDQLRGLDRFIRLANRLLASALDLLFVVVGSGAAQRSLDVRFVNQDYRAALLKHVPLAQPDRFWFLGQVPPATRAEVLRASDLHVYPARPYPVARSLLEAMGAGCVVLASDTEPVREVMANGRTGLLLAAEDLDASVQQARAVLQDPAAYRPLGEAAAARVQEDYAQEVTLPRLARWFDDLVNGGQ